MHRDAQGIRWPRPGGVRLGRTLEAVVYANAFLTGVLVMSLEMLGSRYLAPTFGAGIYTWAALIAVVLAALATGYFLGGRMADARPSPLLLGALLLAVGLWLAAIPWLSALWLSFLSGQFEDVRFGALAAALALFFVPQTLLGAYSPFALRLVLRATTVSGTISGRIYGTSTLGGIVGVLGVTFYLIPLAGTRAITYGLAVLALLCGLSFLMLGAAWRRRAGAIAALLAGATMFGAGLGHPRPVMAEEPPRQPVTAAPSPVAPEALLALPNGTLEEVETAYTSVFVRKHGSYLLMGFRLRGQNHMESISNLENPVELPAPYTRAMTAVLLYVERPRSLLMLGLGGGTTTRYLRHYLPDLSVRAVELDPGVIALARKYFGVRESRNFRISEGDARMHLRRNTRRHDIIMVDAYRADTIPFHLMTKEFFRLAKSRLTAGGVLAINLVRDTRLFARVISTMRSVFSAVDGYHIGGQVVAVALQGPSPKSTELRRRSVWLQQRHGFYHDLREIAGLRRALPSLEKSNVLTDDFAPVNYLRNAGGRD